MINSYRQLAAEGLYEELIDDVQELLNSASEHSLTADTLVVGKLFLEVSAIKAVNNQFNIKSFPAQVKNVDFIITRFLDLLKTIPST
jgi:hypothetical protein